MSLFISEQKKWDRTYSFCKFFCDFHPESIPVQTVLFDIYAGNRELSVYKRLGSTMFQAQQIARSNTKHEQKKGVNTHCVTYQTRKKHQGIWV